MILATVNSKGGVGKSTIAAHLAIRLHESEVRTILVDADVQGSSSVWVTEAAPNLRVERLQTVDEVLEESRRLADECEVLLIDGPAGLSEVSRGIMLVADLVLLPCGPSVLDLRAASEAVRVLAQARKIRGGDPDALLIPNKIQTNYRLSREMLETAETLGISVTPALGLRQAFADAAGQGTVVWRMGSPAAAASSEMIHLTNDIISHAKTIHERRAHY